MDNIIGKTLGKYTIVKSLGQGGMAQVYLACQAKLDRYVALKLIKSAAPGHPEERLRLFEREAKSAAALRHANIVRLYDFDVDAETGRPYMVMEFIEGEPLEHYVVRREALGNPLSLAEVEGIMSDMCAALAYAHQSGVVHRDVKLANIMRDKSGHHILTDFGLAKVVASPSITGSGLFGTPDYMSPEQIMSQEVDGRTDLYALGVMLYRLLTGRMPYTSDTPAGVIFSHINTPVPDPRHVRLDLPTSLARCIVKGLAKSPDQRFQTADEFWAALRLAFADISPTSQPPVDAGPRAALDTPLLASRAPLAAALAPQARQDESRWDMGMIRQLLNEAFNDDDLMTLCFDYFRQVYDKFSDGMSKAGKIQQLLAHCVSRNQVEELLNAVARINPQKYNDFEPSLRRGKGVEGSRTPPHGVTPISPWVTPAPFQAPTNMAWFVGRDEELADICKILDHSTGNNIYCLTGMGGIGKTALAARIAHTLRADYAEGVLWGNAFTSEPLAILESWARAYQCDFSGLPDLDSRAAALRNVLADKKVLIILDDVWNADKVRSLFPGNPRCTILLTTRDLEVAAALNAFVYPIEALSPQESFQLMCRILGDERVMEEKDRADEICQLLMHLPLAVEIAAQRLASRKRWTLADLAERLRVEHNRLNELQVGNHQVRASFAVSWAVLDEKQRQALASSAVFEGRAFTAPALAAVAEMDARAARDLLDSLVALSLMAEEGKAHYHQHPLLTDFACEKLEQPEAAYARMAQYYLNFAHERKSKYAELEAEWNNIWAGIQTAYQQKAWQVVLDYTDALKDMWFARGRYTDARQAYARAVEVSQALEDHRALAGCRLNWGWACIEQGDYAEAEEHLAQSLQMCEELGDQRGVASAQYYLGWIANERSDYGKAQHLLEASQRIREQVGDASGVAEAIWLQADIQYSCGNYAGAEWLGKQALAQHQAAGNRLGCVRTLRTLANIAWHGMSDYEQAEEYCRQALEMCQELQDKGELAATLYTLSEVCRRQGNLQSARQYAEYGLELFKCMDDRKSQARILYRLSLIEADSKNYASASREGLSSLHLCRELGDAEGMVYVLSHLGDVSQNLSQSDQAREMWSEALDIAQGIKHPLAGALRERLGVS